MNVPGRAPYVVLEDHFKRPRGKTDLTGAGLPALVSTTDPTDIEILWDEVPSTDSQVSQRMGDAFKDQQAQMQHLTEMQERMLEAAQGAGTPPGPGVPPSAAGIEMLAENAKRTLSYVQDPAMRKMLIDQYRAAGVQIDEDGGS